MSDGAMSDGALRRAAYVVMVLCFCLYAVGLVLELLNPKAATSWGTGAAAPLIAFVLANMSFAVVGALILHRAPRNRIGWLMLGIGAVWAWSAASEGYILYAEVTRPGALPRPDLVAALSSWLWVPAIGLMGVFLVLLFPDGRLPSPRWRPVAWVATAAIVAGSARGLFLPGVIEDTSVEGLRNPLGVTSVQPLLEAATVAFFALPVCVLVSAAGLIVRFRRSHGVERLQVKWLASAGALVALVYAVAVLATLLSPTSGTTPDWVLAMQDAGLASFIVIPVAVGIAILKHRLYGIDVVINKSVVFAALATFITTVYVVIVVGVGSLLDRADRPNLALSVAATAVVAVAFEPVRDRVQQLANRPVYGTRATPYEVLSDFADRMGGTYAAEELLPMMARTVGEGVGASRAAVWLATATGLELEAAWPPESLATGSRAVGELAQVPGDRVVAVRHRGELLGAIAVLKPPGEAVTPAEQKLLDDVAAQAGLVLRNVRLVEDLRSSRQRLVRAQDEERRRLERNLHDGAQQSIVAVALMIRMVRARLDAESLPVAETLDQAADQLGSAIEQLRALARGIHPVVLTERGLGPALRSMAERSPVPVLVDDRLDERLPAELEGTLYYVVAEALTNVAKHAHASAVEVHVSATATQVALEVVDDGVGGGDAGKGTGLLGLADRVSVVHGTLLLDSPPGGGTRLLCTVPLTPFPRSTDVAPGRQRTTQPLGAGQ